MENTEGKKKCVKCGRWVMIYNTNRHEASCKPKEEKKITCATCTQIFSRTWNYNKHLCERLSEDEQNKIRALRRARVKAQRARRVARFKSIKHHKNIVSGPAGLQFDKITTTGSSGCIPQVTQGPKPSILQSLLEPSAVTHQDQSHFPHDSVRHCIMLGSYNPETNELNMRWAQEVPEDCLTRIMQGTSTISLKKVK